MGLVSSKGKLEFSPESGLFGTGPGHEYQRLKIFNLLFYIGIYQ